MLARHTAPPRWARSCCCGALLLALAGCGKPPSFEVTWAIEDPTPSVEPPPLMGQQCSDVGIFAVRVTVTQEGQLIAIDEYPCVAGTGDGPALDPGAYELEIEGLRRSGAPWDFDPESGLDRVAWAEATVTVVEGTQPLVEVTLLAPPECDDGIDNDRDGTVDEQDPGCDIIIAPAGEALESADSELSLFELSVTFLGSEVVRPSHVGVDSFEIAIDDEVVASLTELQLDLTQSPFRLPLIASDVEDKEDTNGDPEDDNDHVLKITPIGKSGPMAAAMEWPFEVPPGSGAYVKRTFEFAAGDFLQPIVEPVRLAFEPKCTVTGYLSFERMWVRVTDENDQPLTAMALGFSGNWGPPGMHMSIVGVDEPGGWVSFECPNSNVKSIDLPWGFYRIEAQARVGDDVCFSSASSDLAPQPSGDAQLFALERELTGELPTCPECTHDEHCQAQICNDVGLCVDKLP